MQNIILASASPRRKELLEQVGVTFTVKPSTCKEIVSEADPARVVVSLAHQKASDVAQNEEDALVIGSDTIVSIDNHILGKPKTKEEAYRMLKMLQDNTHQVFTGVSVIRKQNGKEEIYSFYSSTDVSFYKMTDEEINHYIDSGEPMDKAGAYGIQGKSAIYIKEIHGDYNTVVGLPVAMLYQTLRINGIDLLDK